MRPLIGITCSELRRREACADARGRAPARGAGPRPDLREGGRARPARSRSCCRPMASEAVDDLLEGLAGLCLSGGPDLDPARYAAAPHPALGPTEPEVDRFELGARAAGGRAQAADPGDLPRRPGAQRRHAAARSTSTCPTRAASGERVEHRQTEPGDEVTHSVERRPGHAPARADRRDEVDVNSFHHQAVDRLGRDLRRHRPVPRRRDRGDRDRPATRSRSGCSGTPSAWSTAPSTSGCSRA